VSLHVGTRIEVGFPIFRFKNCETIVILRGDKKCAEGFLRGLFEANGYNDKQGCYVALSAISPILIRQVQVLLLSLSIPSSIRINGNSKASFGKKDVYTLNITNPRGLEIFKENIGF